MTLLIDRILYPENFAQHSHEFFWQLLKYMYFEEGGYLKSPKLALFATLEYLKIAIVLYTYICKKTCFKNTYWC